MIFSNVYELKEGFPQAKPVVLSNYEYRENGGNGDYNSKVSLDCLLDYGAGIFRGIKRASEVCVGRLSVWESRARCRAGEHDHSQQIIHIASTKSGVDVVM